MNCGVPADAAKLISELKPLITEAKAKVALGVPFTALAAAVEAAAYSNIKIAAENCHFEEKGAFTGEISPLWLAKMGVSYVILGHSERREYFAETDETVNKKVHAALKYGLKPIVCCGETLEQRKANIHKDFIKGQIVGALKDVPADKMCQITIAYEPIWAIGTGEVATDEQAEEICALIREQVKDLYDEEIAAAITIQYGGSVKSTSAKGLFTMPNINGGLVGGASLKADEFSKIVLAEEL
ncbi:MAG: triose-phosphate isomerase [Saccharofermentans sp.]|nr:triose-phosphate isomerase [Saccharofermentans sp.]